MYDAHGRIDHAIMADAVSILPINEYHTAVEIASRIGLAKGASSTGAVSTAVLCGYEVGKFVRKNVGGELMHRRIGTFEDGELYKLIIKKRNSRGGADRPDFSKYKMSANPTVIRGTDEANVPQVENGGALPALAKHLENARVAATMFEDEMKQAEACLSRIRKVVG